MRNKFLAFSMPVLILLFALATPGCARQLEQTEAEVKTYHSGNLTVSEKGDAPKTIYIDVHGGDTNVLVSHLERALRDTKFKIVDSPSDAGYILHVSLVREGAVDPAIFPEIVNAGYGKDARFTGNGASAIVTDALLVKRRVPTASRPSHVRLKNISARNALDNSRMRLGFMIEKPVSAPKERTALFAEPLARELKKALLAQPLNTAFNKQ